MNTYIHFAHEQQKSIKRDLSDVKDWQQFIIDCGEALCKDDVLIFSEKCYCHASLGEFLNAMYHQHSEEVNLFEIYEHFQEKLVEIQLNTVKNWQLGLLNNDTQTSKREELKKIAKQVIFTEEQILYIIDVLSSNSTDK